MAYDVPLRLLSKVKISVKIKGLCECHNCLLFWLSVRPAIRAPRFNTGKSNYFFSRSKHFANFSCCRLEIYCITPQNSPFCEGNTRATALFFINELRNRHMLVNPPEEWNEQDKYKASNNIDVPNSLKTLLLAIATRELSAREMMENMGLKARANFLATYLTPAINQGLVRMYYPDNPRHPRQKYLLSAKGLAWLNGASGGNWPAW